MESLHQESSIQDQQQGERMNSLNLKWTIGFNYNIINGVHNMTNHKRREIFYASAHTGVIYDYENNTQRLLQGHCNKITCTAYCSQEDILITADSGIDSMLVVWDGKTGLPRKTIMDPHPSGVQAMDVTPDGQLIVTCSKEESGGNQQVSLWNWQIDKEAMITHEMPATYEYFNHIRFNQFNTYEFATTGMYDVRFFSWEPNLKGFQCYKAEKNKQIVKKKNTQTAFIPNSKQAVTGTEDGFIIVFDISLIMEDYSIADQRRSIKMVNFMNNDDKLNANQQQKKSETITILQVQDQYLIVGSSNGQIRFYDFQYRIIAWFEDEDITSITSISFSQDYHYSNRYQKQLEQKENSKEDKEYEEVPFECPDFIVVDKQAKITELKCKYFEETSDDKTKGLVLLQSIISPIISISAQPNSNVLAFSCKDGQILQWNFQERQPRLQLLKHFEFVTLCLDYSPDGKYLSCANEFGKVFIYDMDKPNVEGNWLKLNVSEHENGKINSPNILQQVFSKDSQNLATLDQNYTVSLFKLAVNQMNADSEEREWQFFGKMRLHTLNITSISFGETRNEQGEVKLKLFSIGEDRRLAEYDVDSSTFEQLVVVSNCEIEQEAMPTASVWYPCSGIGEDILLTVNNEYKIKLWQILQNGQKICKKTCLGPTYQGPIKKLQVIRSSNNKIGAQQSYLAYTTMNKVIGIIKLPLDGNPNNTIGLVAHPEEITDMSATSDGKYIMTSGGSDLSINLWHFDVENLEQSFTRDKHDMGEDIYPNFLEGGHEGNTYKDLKDFFYYAQIRAKGENMTEARTLNTKVPYTSISEMMRALGYYPTEKEVQNMQNEVKYSKMAETGAEIQYLGIEEFLKLFVNHRPVYGITRNMIEESIKAITGGKKSIKRQEFIDCLSKEGEKINTNDLKTYIKVLLGDDNLDDILPAEIDTNFILDDLLGFEDLDEMTRDHIYSIDQTNIQN